MDEEEFITQCVIDLLDSGEAADTEEATAMCQDLWDERSRPKTVERRSSQLEIRAKGRRLEGYAATFGVEARIGDFVESIAHGAFAKSLTGGDVLALVDHDPGRLLARTRSKSLRLSTDNRGLFFDLDVPATSIGNDVLALAERNDLGGMSFGFTVPKGGDNWNGNKRTLTNIDLREISVVSAWPAYEGTVVNARAKGGAGPTHRLSLARRYLETL